MPDRNGPACCLLTEPPAEKDRSCFIDVSVSSGKKSNKWLSDPLRQQAHESFVVISRISGVRKPPDIPAVDESSFVTVGRLPPWKYLPPLWDLSDERVRLTDGERRKKGVLFKEMSM